MSRGSHAEGPVPDGRSDASLLVSGDGRCGEATMAERLEPVWVVHVRQLSGTHQA